MQTFSSPQIFANKVQMSGLFFKYLLAREGKDVVQFVGGKLKVFLKNLSAELKPVHFEIF